MKIISRQPKRRRFTGELLTHQILIAEKQGDFSSVDRLLGLKAEWLLHQRPMGRRICL